MASLNDSDPGSASQRSAAQAPRRMARDEPPTAPSQAEPERHLGVIAPVDPRGRHELLRVAAGLAPLLHGPTGASMTKAIADMGIEQAPVERVVTTVKDVGAIALVDGVLFALGRHSFLEDIGVRPHMAEVRVAERIERSGAIAFFVVAVARAHCLGVIGAPAT